MVSHVEQAQIANREVRPNVLASADKTDSMKVASSQWSARASSALALCAMKVFRARLAELGYIEGQNITIQYRAFQGEVERLPNIVAEFVQLNPEVIVAVGNEATLALKNATADIPIVMVSTADAVKRGFVASLARPGGNITGLTSIGVDINGKRLELLKEILPKLSRELDHSSWRH